MTTLILTGDAKRLQERIENPQDLEDALLAVKVDRLAAQITQKIIDHLAELYIEKVLSRNETKLKK